MASNIVLADAQATPVNHTFVPMGRDKNGVFWFEDQSLPSAIGYWKISAELVKPSVAVAKQNSEGRTSRVKIGLHEPILETVSNATVTGIAPAPTISYVVRSYFEFVLPERASLQNRKDIRKMAANLLADATIVATVENLSYIS
ncbi:coat protein [ssRNA phage Zoerhiza.2_28]|uniref:Coat protein n=2 Tax=Fiersviridae TaxID=2842319 RepID=A0A8S5L3U7_9VIRU|nr:coat protein [ssRNA phage Zoerhiza.2_28]QDH90112.1 MAG: hypothetical protein H2Rhizo33706_000002 [Leviviridae sp.]DAD52055.1 TPA_asm: coat protein [ssRNA phage Zoerhiza.2_28]